MRHELSRQEHGLGRQAKLVFLKKGAQRDMLTIDDGTVVIIDADDGKLICSVSIHDTTTMEPQLFSRFDDAIATLYQHATARHSVKTNGSAKKVKRHGCYQRYGKMYAMGFRPGYKRKVQGGMYNLYCLLHVQTLTFV